MAAASSAGSDTRVIPTLEPARAGLTNTGIAKPREPAEDRRGIGATTARPVTSS